ncbi:Peptidase S24-like protein [uncultured archaeon]|nr:Peptidase S24-like protein [uncultured archaeon]
MLEYIFTGILAAILVLLYIFINHQNMAGRLLSKIPSRNDKKSRLKLYMERFSEQKESNMSRNIIVQALPWLCVLTLVFILGNHYFVFATVLSGSMEPTFKKGDLVLMQSLDLKAKVGDIVMFPMWGFKEPILHRVVSITGDGSIITRGDANSATDSSGFPPDRIIGKAVLISDKPIVLKGFGYSIRPQNIGEQQILTKLPSSFVLAEAFQQFQVLQPLFIVFATIFYFFLLMENRTGSNRRLSKNRGNGRKKV